MTRLWICGLAALVGCTATQQPVTQPATTGLPSTDAPLPSDVVTPPTNGACDYPSDPVRPMEVGEVLFPYSWPDVRDLATGVQGTLDLGNVPCAVDPTIDWSPFDVLLFVSIPAW